MSGSETREGRRPKLGAIPVSLVFGALLVLAGLRMIAGGAVALVLGGLAIWSYLSG